MAKPKRDESSRSVLKLAYEAFERGDAVQTRALARAVLAGTIGRDDEKVAVELAKELSAGDAVKKDTPDAQVATGDVVAPTPEAVAKELIDRTIVPLKPYVMVAVVAGAFITLVVIAASRY